jgi:hypothetical protein
MEKLLCCSLNGAASEPTHIYDPKLLFFCMELARHITYMYEISVAIRNGVPYLNIEQVWKNTDCISNKTIKLWTSNRIKWEWSLIGGNDDDMWNGFNGTTKITVEVIYR